jgi:hypothetical protein
MVKRRRNLPLHHLLRHQLRTGDVPSFPYQNASACRNTEPAPPPFRSPGCCRPKCSQRAVEEKESPSARLLPGASSATDCVGRLPTDRNDACRASNWLVGLLTPALNDFSTLALYLFFLSWCALALVFALVAVPETRGVSLEEMAAVFGDSTALVDEERRTRIAREIAAESTACRGEERRGLLGEREREGSGSDESARPP